MKKVIFILTILSIVSQKIAAQIAITEVYYDTPFSERGGSNPNLGEFVELYNYTKENISLEGWFLRDNTNSYPFPKGTVIKSGDFLIVAYKRQNGSPYFPNFFPNTKGQESKILYQDKLVFNNFNDGVVLFTQGSTLAKDVSIPEFLQVEVDKAGWLVPEYIRLPSNNRYKYERKKFVTPFSNYNPKTAEGDGSKADYYIKSLQKSGEDTYNENNKANPLTALYKPALVEYKNSLAVKNVYQNHYALLTWAYYVNQILNNTCSYSISVIEQSNSGFAVTSTEQCFKHDAAGNMDVKSSCTSTTTSSSTSAANLQNDLEEIKNRIVIYPNPTSSKVTITWDSEVNKLISQMKIVALNGAYTVSVPQSASNYTFTADLSAQTAGIYILLVSLTTGNSVSKSIIKL